MEEFKKSLDGNLQQQLIKFGKENWQIAPDITGLFDPTPISNVASLGIAVWNLDLLDMAGAVASYIPGVDAANLYRKLGKLGEPGVRAGKMIGMYFSKFSHAVDAQKEFLGIMGKDAMVKARADALKKAQEEAMKARKAKANCRECREDMKRKMQLPTKGGKWYDEHGNRLKEPPMDGTGTFKFDEPRKLPDSDTVVSEIKYKGGEPDFSPYVTGKRYQLDHITGDATEDAKQLARENKGFVPPDKDDYVLHHFNDGSVGYIPRIVHDRDLNGASHTGGNSLLNSNVF